MPGATFSEIWYQVAQERVALLPAVVVTRHRYRGDAWFVLEDTYSQKYFRVTPQAYAFLRALNTGATVDEVWQRMAREQPEMLPGQDEVVRLLSQLHMASLLYFQGQPQVDAIYERTRTQRRRELYGKALSFLYVKIALWDPDSFLNRIRALIRVMTSPVAMMVWLTVMITAGLNIYDKGAQLAAGTDGLLSLSNLPFLYLCMTGLKIVHEFAHSFAVKRFGGQVHVFGVMFLIFTPLPYMDATASWSFRNKFQRAIVGLAGMLSELFVAAIGAIVWAHTGPGLVHSLAYNVMIIGSVSSLLFNGNPLLRFDAYYVLADLLEIPNLYSKAQQQWFYFFQRYLLGIQTATSPAIDRNEWRWLTVYGFLAFFYRWFVTTGIVLFMLDQWFPIGLMLLTTSIITLIFMPLRKFYTWMTGPALVAHRGRAFAGLAITVATLLVFAVALPLPYAVRAPGVLEARQTTQLFARTGGVLSELKAQHGQRVAKGEVIAVLLNPEMDNELKVARLLLRESESLYRQALVTSPADLVPLQRRAESQQARVAELERDLADLVVTAPQAGEFVAPVLVERLGNYVERGSLLGEVVDSSEFRFSAVVSQDQAAAMFSSKSPQAGLRLVGQAGTLIEVADLQLIPYQRQRLASAALGFLGGGDVAVRPDDQAGTLATEPFFMVNATLTGEALKGVSPYNGLSGVLRVKLPGESLYRQLREGILQTLQKRYGFAT
jgi:putative peptide zinc metalloprotease protein